MLHTRFPLFIMKTLTYYCHKHKRSYLIQLALNSPPINFGWVSWSEQKIKSQTDAGTEFELRHWVIGWPWGQSLDLCEPQQPNSTTEERQDLTEHLRLCPGLPAKLQNSKISMLIQKHFLNDSADPSDFFLKGWEWPGSQWGRRMISLVLAGWALLTVWLQKMWVGLPKIPWKIHCQCWQDRKYKQKHLCVCWAQLYMGY